ncbi:MAG: endonuclease/exonuclease/phosphatase family protein [Bacteroidales bacterium]|nr:endonuclease/exonuclease/phosphatase family protein [Bacteroidales bacterium]
MTVSPEKKKRSSSARVSRKSSGIKRFSRNILLSVNMILAAALILAYLSIYINPSATAIPSLFGLAYPYIVAANIIMVLIWVIFRKWYALVSISLIAIGFGYLHNFIRFSNHGSEEHHDLKVMSYNIRLFNYYEDSQRDSYRKMLQLMRKEEPGIICLQEYFVKGSPWSGEKKLKEGLGGRVYTHFKLIKSGSSSHYGIATITRYPIIRRGDIVHPGSSSLTIFTDIVVDADTFRIYNNHLQSFRLRRVEGNLLTEITGEVQEGSMSNVKEIYKSLINGFASRSLQADRVKEHISTSPYPVIVAGDFNDTPVSYTYRKMRRGLKDAFVEAGYGAGFTYRGKYPPNRIDYILYNEEIECNDFDIVKARYSDHYPVIAYFRRADQKGALPGQHSHRK